MFEPSIEHEIRLLDRLKQLTLDEFQEVSLRLKIDPCYLSVGGPLATQAVELLRLVKRRGQITELESALSLIKSSARAEYLRRARQEISSYVSLPPILQKTFSQQLRTLPIKTLHRFRRADESGHRTLSWDELHASCTPPRLLLSGESGIGKSHLMEQVFLEQAHRASTDDDQRLPVLIRLGVYNENLHSLILKAIGRYGLAWSDQELHRETTRGRLLFLFDAYDEANSPRLERDLQQLVQDAPGCGIIITTRASQKPRAGPVSEYVFEELSSEGIAEFVARQVEPAARGEFMDQIHRKGLLREASNTLILSMLILLHQQGSNLFSSRGRILDEVMKRVRERELGKRRGDSPLPWEAVELLLARIAFQVLVSGSEKTYSLDHPKADEVIGEALIELRDDLTISHTTRQTAFNQLTATGFLRKEPDRWIFWHRAFLEYFAAQEITRRIENGRLDINDKMLNAEWSTTLPSAIAHLSNIDTVLRSVLQQNIFLAGEVLAESARPNKDLADEVLRQIEIRCSSAHRAIRDLAFDILRRTVGEEANSTLIRLLEAGPPNIQTRCLVEIARRALPEARTLIAARRDWDIEADLYHGGGRAAVIGALGFIGDAKSQHEILSLWSDSRNSEDGWAARNAFARLASLGILDDEVKEQLANKFLALTSSDPAGIKALHDLEHVFITLADSRFASRAIESLRSSNGELEYYIRHVVAAQMSDEIARQLFDVARDTSCSDVVRHGCTLLLSESQINIPKSWFVDIFEADSSDWVRCRALEGLSARVDQFDEILPLVSRSLEVPTKEELQSTRSGYDNLQAAVIRVLARHHQLERFFKPTPRPIFRFAVRDLVEACVQQNLTQFIGYLCDLFDRWDDGYVRAVLGVGILQMMDEQERDHALEHVLDHIGTDHLAWGRLVQGAHRLGRHGLELVRRAWQFGRTQEKHASYLRTECVEALAKIGTQEAAARLVGFTEEMLDQSGFDAENCIQGFWALSKETPKWEAWFLQLLHPHCKLANPAHALMILGAIGGTGSEPVLRDYLRSDHRWTREAAFRALTALYGRRGRLWYDGEERG